MAAGPTRGVLVAATHSSNHDIMASFTKAIDCATRQKSIHFWHGQNQALRHIVAKISLRLRRPASLHFRCANEAFAPQAADFSTDGTEENKGIKPSTVSFHIARSTYQF
jgi:hypothetical protein